MANLHLETVSLCYVTEIIMCLRMVFNYIDAFIDDWHSIKIKLCTQSIYALEILCKVIRNTLHI